VPFPNQTHCKAARPGTPDEIEPSNGEATARAHATGETRAEHLQKRANSNPGRSAAWRRAHHWFVVTVVGQLSSAGVSPHGFEGRALRVQNSAGEHWRTRGTRPSSPAGTPVHRIVPHRCRARKLVGVSPVAERKARVKAL
jgi:hypothetical protein